MFSTVSTQTKDEAARARSFALKKQFSEKIVIWFGSRGGRLSRMPAEKSSKDAAVAGAGINAARRERKDAGASGSSA